MITKTYHVRKRPVPEYNTYSFPIITGQIGFIQGIFPTSIINGIKEYLLIGGNPPYPFITEGGYHLGADSALRWPHPLRGAAEYPFVKGDGLSYLGSGIFRVMETLGQHRPRQGTSGKFTIPEQWKYRMIKRAGGKLYLTCSLQIPVRGDHFAQSLPLNLHTVLFILFGKAAPLLQQLSYSLFLFGCPIAKPGKVEPYLEVQIFLWRKIRYYIIQLSIYGSRSPLLQESPVSGVRSYHRLPV